MVSVVWTFDELITGQLTEWIVGDIFNSRCPLILWLVLLNKVGNLIIDVVLSNIGKYPLPLMTDKY